MIRAYGFLLHEPYCWTPDQLAKVPLFVLEHAYRRPLQRMLRQRRRLMRQARGESAPASAPPVKLERESFAQHMVALHGGSQEQWLAEFDRGIALRAQWEAKHGQADRSAG